MKRANITLVAFLVITGCLSGTDAPQEVTTDTIAKVITETPVIIVEPSPEEQPPAEPEWLQAMDLAAFLDSVGTGEMLSGLLVMKFTGVTENWGYTRHKGLEEVFTTDDGIRWIVLSEFTGVGENYLIISYDSEGIVLDEITLRGPHDVDQTDGEWSYETYSILGNNAFNIMHHLWTADENGELEETTESTLQVTAQGKFETVAG